jgi:hypothetical protein
VKARAVSIERLLSAAQSKQINNYLEANMATVTDTDLQQLKDLITTLHTATQKQITDGYAAIQRQITDGNTATQKQIAGVEIGLSEVKGEIKEVKAEIKGIHTELTDIKTNQRAQDNRFFALIFFILTTAIGITAKLAKLY